MIYFDKETLGFYMDNGAGRVQISQSLRDELLTAEAKGKIIIADENGGPIAIPLPPASALETSLSEKLRRERIADVNINALKPAVDGGYAKTEHIESLANWQRYRYEIILVPEQPGWPESPQWPGQPETII